MSGSDRQPVGRQDFDRFAARLDGPALLVTTVSGSGERSGCLVGFATQCSIEPPRYLVCISERNHTFGVVADAALVAVHVVPPGAEDVARLLAETTGDLVDKFAHLDWTPGPDGVPLLDACPARFVGRILHRLADLGDHVGLVLAPVEVGATPPDESMLTVQQASSFHPGHPE